MKEKMFTFSRVRKSCSLVCTSGVIKQSDRHNQPVVQNKTVFVQDPSTETEKIFTNSLLERKLCKSMSLWSRLLDKKKCKAYRSWFMYKNYEYLQHLEWQSGAIYNKLETVFSGIFNSE